MINILSTEDMPNSYIERMKSKVGFYTSNEYDDNSLRLAISSFPYCMRYKGSFEGIRRCVNVYLKHLGVRGKSRIDIYNSLPEEQDVSDEQDVYEYTIRIGIPSNMADTTLLKDMLSYVVPTGYFLDIYFFKETALDPTESKLHSEYNVLFPTEDENTSVRGEVGYQDNTNEIKTSLANSTFATVQLGMVYEPLENQDKEQEDEE
jgi:hypothetical protein